jgi:heme exporter protein C
MRIALAGISLFLLLLSASLALTTAAVTPAARNIVYVHVPTAFCSLISFCVLFFCSIQYLRTKQQKWDHTAAAAAQAGLLFATAMNLTGMIFARIEWGAWWTPSPRLISSAVLWFLYVAYFLLRSAFESRRRKETLSAVFGIIAFIDVPLVLISARLVPDIHRPSFTFDAPAQMLALASATLGSVLLMTLLILYLKLSKEWPCPHTRPR